MQGRMSRRRALFTGGTVGLGALLAACSDGSGSPAATAVPTVDGGTATVRPQVTASTSAALEELFAGSATCTLTKQETEGPYYFDADSVRSDIREDRLGTRLRLAIRVQDLPECTPVPNAVVDIWHCDAGGVYSGFEAASRGGPGGGRTDDEKYLRGAQVTNAQGIVEFVTIYPGWYRGRTVHIHIKVHLDNKTMLTSQLYFPEEVSSAVYAAAPYNQRTGRDRLNNNDSIFDQSLVLTVRPDGDGYLGVMTVGVDAP